MTSGENILRRISDHEGALEINSILPGSLFVEESRWFLALAGFPIAVRAHIRPKNLSSATSETVGEVAEPLFEFVQ